MRIFLVVVWHAFAVGIYWDRKEKKLLILPVPMFGICLDFGWSTREYKRLHKPFDYVIMRN